jgi:hypothetical protein
MTRRRRRSKPTPKSAHDAGVEQLTLGFPGTYIIKRREPASNEPREGDKLFRVGCAVHSADGTYEIVLTKHPATCCDILGEVVLGPDGSVPPPTT